MAVACPAPAPEDPLVQGLLSTVDCNVQSLVYGGYSSLFAPGSPFAAVLTALLTVFVAMIGYSLLLGRGRMRVGDVALTAVKLGAVLALTTQWSTYQAVVYAFLFDGPQQLAGAMLTRVQPDGSAAAGDVFGGLQRTFDLLTAFADGYAKAAPVTASPLMGGAGSGAMMLSASAAILLLSSLGVLLAAKVVLGLLLAVGPVFIALLLFDSTRGLFEGWLRAALAFAFAPLTATLLLGVALTMLEPSLVQLSELSAQRSYPLGPVYGVLTLVLVFTGVSAGMIVAGGMIAGGFRLPGRSGDGASAFERGQPARPAEVLVDQPRAARVAAATAALDRRESAVLARDAAGASGGGGGGEGDRRLFVAAVNDAPERGPRDRLAAAPDARIGQAPRRGARPRTARFGARRT